MSVAVIIAVGVNDDGRREMLGMTVGASEIETFWTEFLRSLARRGLRGVKLAISDAHEGLKAAVAKVLHATWQRCRVHTMRNLLAHAGRQGRGAAAAFIATAFAQDAAAVEAQWRKVADQLRPKLPKLPAAMDDAEVDVRAARMGRNPATGEGIQIKASRKGCVSARQKAQGSDLASRRSGFRTASAGCSFRRTLFMAQVIGRTVKAWRSSRSSSRSGSGLARSSQASILSSANASGMRS